MIKKNKKLFAGILLTAILIIVARALRLMINDMESLALATLLIYLRGVIHLSLALVWTVSVPVFAAEVPEETVSPRWTSIANMHVDMAFVGTAGNASGTARKQSTADVIVGTLYLYKWNGSTYEYITEVSGRKTIGTLGLSIDFEAESGVQYRAILTVVAYTNNIGEMETIEYLETCP